MKITLTFSMFCDEWNKWDDRKNTFSYNGKRALFDYLERLEQDTGEETELDIVALCCEYTEFQSAIEAASEYATFEGMTFNDDGSEAKTLDEVDKEAREYLNDNTTVIDIDGGGVIIQNF